MSSSFETRSVRMQSMLLMIVQAPIEDGERIMIAITQVTPLAVGAYDNNAFQSGAGTERYRPLQGAAAGAGTEIRQRSGVVEIGFELPDEQSVAERAVEAVFQVHSYGEPVIRLPSLLSSRSKGHDDRANPNRWWNTTGDRKRTGAG